MSDDILTRAIPLPDPTGSDLDVMRDRRGAEALERDLLASNVVALSRTCQQLQAQVAALRAENARLTSKDEEKSGPTEPEATPVDTPADALAASLGAKPEPEPIKRPVGYVSPYAGADGSGA